MSEFDARSRVPNDIYRQAYDRIFDKAKKEREVRSDARNKELDEDCGGTGNRYELTRP